MRNASLILLQDPPQPDPEVHGAELGSIADGIFLADRFPVVAVFGGLLRLEFEKGEFGSHELLILLSSVIVPGEGEVEVPIDSFDEMARRDLRVVEPDPSWTTPRNVFVPMTFELVFPSESDLLLWAVLDDHLIAEHPLLVRTPDALPQAIGPDDLRVN